MFYISRKCSLAVANVLWSLNMICSMAIEHGENNANTDQESLDLLEAMQILLIEP